MIGAGRSVDATKVGLLDLDLASLDVLAIVEGKKSLRLRISILMYSIC